MPDQPRVVVTRRAEQAQSFCQQLRAAGMIPLLFPAIQLQALPAPELDEALSKLDSFEWIIFSSANAVDFFFRRAGQDLTLPKTAVVGSATALKLARFNIQADFMPQTFTGEALASGLGDLTSQAVLLPRAKKGGSDIVRTLQEQGAEVADIALYDTVTAEPSPEAMQLLRRGYEALTFASPSSVHGFLQIMNGQIDPAAIVLCIGPVTAQAAREAGIQVSLVPEEYTVGGMVHSLSRYFNQIGQLPHESQVSGR